MTPQNPIPPFLEDPGYLVLDGGLASELEHAGFDLGDHLWSARLLLEAPEAIAEIHRQYLEAGADCIISASYQATIEGFMACVATAAIAAETIRGAVALAVEARDGFWANLRDRGDRRKPQDCSHRPRRSGVARSPSRLRLVARVVLGREDEVAFRETVDLVRVDRHLDTSPGEQDVRVVALGLGNLAEPGGEIECLADVAERVLLLEVVLLDDPPAAAKLLCQARKLVTFQRRNASPARHTLLLGQLTSHDFSSVSSCMSSR